MNMVHTNKKKAEKVLISCGILKEEIRFLIDKNQWVIKPVFLNSSLHVDFDKLWKALNKSLEVHADTDKYVCYGTCHPLMGKMIKENKAKRTAAQNCVELVLGKEKFNDEIEKGAFFLFEDWANNWKTVTGSVFGTDPEILKEVFQSEHSYLMAIKTPCSNDFSEKANEISLLLDLPVKWINVGLEHLEKELVQTLT